MQQEVWVATFHSTCLRILRRYADRIGYTSDFSIYDADDQKTLMKNIFKALNIDTKNIREKTALNVISSAKDELITPKQFAEQVADYCDEQIVRAYIEYQNQLNLKRFKHCGYKVKKIQPVDMFLFTDHVTTVVLMSRV